MRALSYLIFWPVISGVAVQQALEILYAFVPHGNWQDYKKLISKVLAITLGAGFAMQSFGHGENLASAQLSEIFLAGLITAASSEITNSVIKCLVYAKEARKAAAAQAVSTAGSISLGFVSRK